MRVAAAFVLVVACGGREADPVKSDPPALPKDTYIDLASAIAAVVPADAKVVGFGEIHARVDRAVGVKSALARFTEALPSFADRVSDLAVETWIVNPSCGGEAKEATARVEQTMKRPEATKSEIATLADAAKAKGVQPLAMTMTCEDYKVVAPAGKDVDAVAMLDLVTRELTRLSTGAAKKPSSARPWVAVYGGALHNDRFPEAGTEEWSYAKAADEATGGKFVEVDLIVPELAAGDATSKRQPWFGLVTGADDKVHVFKRGERSFVLVLPKT